jgi:hypothetical protein
MNCDSSVNYVKRFVTQIKQNNLVSPKRVPRDLTYVMKYNYKNASPDYLTKQNFLNVMWMLMIPFVIAIISFLIYFIVKKLLNMKFVKNAIENYNQYSELKDIELDDEYECSLINDDDEEIHTNSIKFDNNEIQVEENNKEDEQFNKMYDNLSEDLKKEYDEFCRRRNIERNRTTFKKYQQNYFNKNNLWQHLLELGLKKFANNALFVLFYLPTSISYIIIFVLLICNATAINQDLNCIKYVEDGEVYVPNKYVLDYDCINQFKRDKGYCPLGTISFYKGCIESSTLKEELDNVYLNHPDSLIPDNCVVNETIAGYKMDVSMMMHQYNNLALYSTSVLKQCYCSDDMKTVECADSCNSPNSLVQVDYQSESVRVCYLKDIQRVNQDCCKGGDNFCEEMYAHCRDKHGICEDANQNTCGFCIGGHHKVRTLFAEETICVNTNLYTNRQVLNKVADSNFDVVVTAEVTDDGVKCPQGFININGMMYCVDENYNIGPGIKVFHNEDMATISEVLTASLNIPLSNDCQLQEKLKIAYPRSFPYSNQCDYSLSIHSKDSLPLNYLCNRDKFEKCPTLSTYIAINETHFKVNVSQCIMNGEMVNYPIRNDTKNCNKDCQYGVQGEYNVSCYNSNYEFNETTIDVSVETKEVKNKLDFLVICLLTIFTMILIVITIVACIK